MRYIKGLIIVTLMAFSSAFFVENINLVSIEKVEALCGPGQYASNGQTCASTSASNYNSNLKGTLVNDFTKYYSMIAGVILAIAISVVVYAAYTMVTSAGVPDKVSRAKALLFGGGLGTIIILSGFTLMRLFLSFVG